MISIGKLRTLALATTIATGFTGLVYEVTWHRYLSNIVGSEARATSIILAVFLGGMSIGYELMGRISRHRSPAFNVKLLGYCEIAIGVWALIFDQLFAFLQGFAPSLPLAGLPALLSEIGVASLLMLIPTMLMGSTLPLLTQSLSLGLADAPGFHAKVYAINTAGAFLGCLTAGFFLLPHAGLPLTLFYMAPLNIVAGLVLGLVSSQLGTLESSGPNPGSDSDLESASAQELPTRNEDSGEGLLKLSKAQSFVIAGLAGFYAICLQTVLVRLTGLSLGSSEYAFSMIVSLYICMLAYGAARMPEQETITSYTLLNNQVKLLAGALFVFLSLPYWPYLNHLVRITFSTSSAAFYGYFLANFLWIGLILSPMLLPMGRTLPLLFGASPLKNRDLGNFVGSLYGLNTLGCVAGALLGGYLSLYFIDLDQVFKLTLVLMTVTVLILTLKIQKKWMSAQALALVGLILILPAWNKTELGHGIFRMIQETPFSYSGKDTFYRENLLQNRSLLDYKDGPSGTIAVYEYSANSKAQAETKDGKDQTDASAKIKDEKPKGASRSILVNGKSDGSTQGGDLSTTQLLAHLPAFFQMGTSGEAAVIGFGTGITVGNLALHPEIKNIDCIEISNVVKDFAKHFAEHNLNAATDPKVHWILADAYRALISMPKTYDVIISEPSNPWVTGVERLYSQDFYQLIKDKLSPGGIYAQWFHTYSIAPDTLGLVINTYHSVFPHVYTFISGGVDLIILGSIQELGPEQISAMKTRFNNPAIIKELDKIGVKSPEQILAKESFNPPKFYFDQGLHTLDFPKLSYAAGKDFFKNQFTVLGNYLESPKARLWVSRFADRTLFAAYDRLYAEKSKEPRQAQIGRYCETQSLSSLPPQWMKASGPCRTALYNGVREGFIETGSLNSDNVTRDLFASYQKTTWTVDNASNFLLGYLQVHSALSPISKSDLDTKVTPCYETATKDASCISLHIRALFVGGFEEEAKRLMRENEAFITEKFGPNSLKIMQELQQNAESYRTSLLQSNATRL